MTILKIFEASSQVFVVPEKTRQTTRDGKTKHNFTIVKYGDVKI
jgi:hypothetical protein